MRDRRRNCRDHSRRTTYVPGTPTTHLCDNARVLCLPTYLQVLPTVPQVSSNQPADRLVRTCRSVPSHPLLGTNEGLPVWKPAAAGFLPSVTGVGAKWAGVCTKWDTRSKACRTRSEPT